MPTGAALVRPLELYDPTAADVAALAHELGLGLGTELSQALTGPLPRARLLVREDGVLLTVRAHAPSGPGTGRGDVTAVVTAERAALIGRGDTGALSETARRLESGEHQPGDVLFTLVDVVLNGVEGALEGLDEEVERIEEGLFGAEDADQTRAIHAVKRELLEVRRSVVPLAADVTRLSGEWSPALPEDPRPRFALLLARAAHSAQGVEHLDALTSSVLAAQLAEIGVRQTQDQRKISAWAAIALVPTGVGAVYGMNFEHMPELTWVLGYPAALTTIFVLCSLLYRGFRRNAWL